MLDAVTGRIASVEKSKVGPCPTVRHPTRRCPGEPDLTGFTVTSFVAGREALWQAWRCSLLRHFALLAPRRQYSYDVDLIENPTSPVTTLSLL